MRETVLTIPELVLIAGTRAAFGVGLGLLLSERLSPDARKGAGWALVAVGALSTVPLVVDVLTKSQIEQSRPIDLKQS